jgi:menaquinone-dependent protoporphyrinogen oxidase
MGQRVLVGYATKTGSTVGVAERIGKVLAERGYDVDVKSMTEAKSLDGYDKIVLGSAVNGGAWLPEAVDFVGSNAKALKSVPVAAFCVHIMNVGDGEKETAKRLAYLDKVRAVVNPIDEGFFLGKGPDKDANFVMKWAFRAFGGAGEGDCRDWDAISGWAQEVTLG